MAGIFAGQQRDRLFEPGPNSLSPTEKMQARASHSSKQEWISKYESNLRRAYKYLTTWKTQPGSLHSTSFPRSSSRTKLRSKTSADNCNEKMGVTQSKTAAEALKLFKDNKTPCLPLELHIEILKYLDWSEQVRLTRVCKTWRAVITDWIIPMDFRAEETRLGPHIINPLFSEVECDLGSLIAQSETLESLVGKRGFLIDQPLCWPPAYHISVRVADVRTDGLEPGVDGSINVVANWSTHSGLRIRDLLFAVDTFYRQVNEDKIIWDECVWTSWKFKLETNRWWRRGYIRLHGKWEWQNGGKSLCLFAKKVPGAWEAEK